MQHLNDIGQPVGAPLPTWKACPPPPRTSMTGRTCRLEMLSRDHLSDLFTAYSLDKKGQIWTYLPCGPFANEADYRAWVEATCFKADPLFHAIIDLKTEKPVGVASYLRIDPAIGSIEVGHINYSPLLQKSVVATEAMYLMMARVFDELGYRRYEWKCDSLNAPSRAAAQRYGFTYEGIFRQCTIYKNRNRDTAWYSILDSEWAAQKTAFQTWLEPSNFDAAGRQKVSLSELTGKRG